MKRFIALLLIFIMTFSLSGYGIASEKNVIMEKNRDYNEGHFKDISQSDWFYKNVITAYEYGVMSGNSEATFNPYGNITISEAITIAVRINQQTVNKNRKIAQDSSDLWYMPYIKYAENAGIISKGKFFDKYEKSATRAEFVYILCNCLDAYELKNENPYTKNIPDMKKEDNYFNVILKAVKSGIISGKDFNGSFYPDDFITRAEASAVLSRIIDRNERKSEIKRLIADNIYDASEFYMENNTIRNYADYNNITSIWSGYYIDTTDSVYMYLYNPNELNAYFQYLKDDGYTVKKSYEAHSLLTEYICKKYDTYINITVLNKYSQVWISFPMSSTYKSENFNTDTPIENEEKTVSSKEEWDSCKNFLENEKISNYGYMYELKSENREVFIDSNGVTRAKYTYKYYPNHFINYCELLDKSGSLDTLTVDSNALFLDFTYIRRDGNIHVFVDLIKSTISIDFEKTKTSDLWQINRFFNQYTDPPLRI